MNHQVPIRQFLIGGAFSSLAAVVATKLFGFAESIAVARILGNYDLGLLALVLSIINVLIALATLGIPQALTKFLSGEASSSDSAARSTLRAALRLVAWSTTLVSLGATAVSVLVLGPYYQNPAFVPLLLTGILVSAISSPLVLFSSSLQGLKRITRLNVLTVLAGAVGLPVAILLSLAWSVQGALVAFLLVSALPGLFSIRSVYASIRGLPRVQGPQPVAPGSLLNFGLPTVASGLVVLSATYILSSMLAVGSGLTNLGNFAVASSLSAVIGFIPAAVGIPLVPMLSSLSIRDPQRGKRMVPRVMRVVCFVSVPIAVPTISFAREIIAVTYGSQFSAASTLLALLTSATLIAAITGVIGGQIAGMGRMWLGLGLNMTWAATVTLSAVPLVSAFGAAGACLSILLAYGVLAFTLTQVGARMLGLRFEGMTAPAIWAFAVVTSSFVAAAMTQYRVGVGIALTAVSLLSGWLLLRPDERALARDAFQLLTPNRMPPTE